MRKLAPLALLLAACVTTPAPPPAAVAPEAAEVHGMTLDEEATVLMLEDRRMYDAEVVERFAAHANALHRQRIALALGRIAPHSFGDANANGQRDATELPSGLEVLNRLASDPDRSVRETVAFALGEIGDPTSGEVLFRMASDSDASVAAEAVEAYSKISASQQVQRHAALTIEKPEGVRARAVRFLFRHGSDAASELATTYLGATEESIRREAAYALSRRAYAPARERLQLLLTERDVLTRAYAVAALGRIAAPESFSTLFPLLGDAHPWVRTNAAVALSLIAQKDPSKIRLDDLPRVIALTEDPDPGTRANSINLLGYYARATKTALDRLQILASNGSRWERELAAAALAKQFAEDRPEFIPATLTDWGKVRVLEATAAMKRGIEIRKSLAADPSAMVRANVIGNIPEAAGDEADIIRAGLNDPDVIVRSSAIDALAHTALSRDEQLAILEAAEKRERSETLNDARLSAIRAYAAIDSGAREYFLRSLIADNDPVVRRIASDLIVEQLKRARPQFTPLASSRTMEDYRKIAEWSRQPHTATVHMTRGTIDLKLLTQDAPMTTWNFVELANKGYFNDTTFMRVVPNFVVQSGDPRNDQNGGPGYSIRDEINLQKYTRGAVGMALSGPDTGGSQYFITHSPQPHLDGGYTIFARVSSGMTGVVDQIERGDLVQTIRIDEHPGGNETASAAVPLPTIIGPITRETLMREVPEYPERVAAYEPDAAVLEMLAAAAKPGDRIEIFLGTWCDDSQREVPRLLKIVDRLRETQHLELPLTFTAVDRAKQKPEKLIAGKSLEKVATMIYVRDNAELGRVVEHPTSLLEDDLLVIASRTAQ